MSINIAGIRDELIEPSHGMRTNLEWVYEEVLTWTWLAEILAATMVNSSAMDIAVDQGVRARASLTGGWFLTLLLLGEIWDAKGRKVFQMNLLL